MSTGARLAHRGARRVDGRRRRHALAEFAVAVGRRFVDDRASGFAAVIGLLSWLWLTAQLVLIAAEVSAVRASMALMA